MKWPKGKSQKDKQWSTKHYLENYRLSNMNFTKNQGAPEGLSVPVLVAPIVLL
jgi:hypothetical protein